MNGRTGTRPAARFEGLTSFEPAQDDDGNVHSARTTVAAIPESFLDDLRRGKAEEPTTSRYKVLPDTDLVPSECETLPAPAAPSEEAGEIEVPVTVEEAPPLDMSPFLIRQPPTMPEPISVAPAGAAVAASSEVPEAAERPWRELALTVLFVLLLLASAAFSVRALLRAG